MAQKQEKTAGQKPEKKGAAEVTVTRRPEALAPIRPPRHLWPMAAWEREIDRMFDDFRRLFPLPKVWGAERWPAGIDVQVPSIDVYEKGDEVVVKAEIAGLSKDDLEVNLTDSMLTVKGEKKKEEEIKDEDFYRCERSFGAFSRTVQLPSEVKADQAKASFKDGVLEVRIPKTEEAKAKSIKVQVQ